MGQRYIRAAGSLRSTYTASHYCNREPAIPARLPLLPCNGLFLPGMARALR